MSRPRVTLLVNPAANTGRAARLAVPVAARLERVADVRVVQADSATGSAELAAEAVDSSDALVVLGGDGIVHQALPALARTEVPLGIVPAGTGNDSAVSIGLPRDPLAAADAIADALAAHRVRRVDLGRADTDDGPRWWLTVLCGGFDSAVNERANKMRWPRGPRRYDVAIAIEAARLGPRPYTLSLDGVETTFEATIVTVCNTPRYGGGKLIAPSAEIDDGRFEVCVIAPVSRLTLVQLASKLDRGAHVGHPAVSFFSATRVRFDAPRIAYADGERIGPLPLSTECVPAALAVLAPPER
jgi:diacylglycerol kinase (ATP)